MGSLRNCTLPIRVPDYTQTLRPPGSPPLGQMVRVDLRGHDFPDLRGRLELSRAPDRPHDPRQPLTLRISTVEFTSRQIAARSLL
jgi:hypothetical protein